MNIQPLIPIDTIVTGIEIAMAFVVAGVAFAGLLQLTSAARRIAVRRAVPAERDNLAPSR